MKLLSLPLIAIGALGLSSCGLLQSATQVPLRTLQSLGRGVGIGTEQTEVEGGQHAPSAVRFEVVEDIPEGVDKSSPRQE